METTNYNENNAYFRAKKSRTKRILWKLNFILLCNSVLILSTFFTTISLVLVSGYWLGIWLVMHALQVFYYSTLEERKIKEILEKIQLTKNGNNHGKYLSREERYFIAKKDEIKGFYSNLASYVFVNLGLLAPILSSLVLLAIARMGKEWFSH
jgi:hypothetical protein